MRASTLSVLWVLVALPGCGERIEGCEYTGSCPSHTTSTAAGGSSGAAGESGSGGEGTGLGGTSMGGIGGTAATGGATTSSGGAVGGSGGTGGTAGSTTTGAGSGGEAGAGTGGSTGGTGGNPPVPCEGACGGATPVCNEETDTCVECLETEDCDEGVCDTDANLCVECLEAEDCEAPTPLCDTEDQLCVECLGNTDCTDTQESLCDGGSCSPCASNADCAHLSGTTVCDTNAGECVQCTPENEAVCGGTSCNPATNTCTTTELGTVDDCQPCVADSECVGGDQEEPLRRCVSMEFNGEPREKAYCLERRSQVSECSRPYFVVFAALSLSGAPEESYCGIAQDLTTCEAVRDFLRDRQCSGDTDCGCPRDEDDNCTALGQGGFCRDLPAGDNRCTYECGRDTHCPNGSTCANTNPDYCQ